MAYVESFICDSCGEVKQKSNHWFLASIVEGEGLYLGRKVLQLASFDSKIGKTAGVRILCGEKCINSYISKSLVQIIPEVTTQGDARDML